MQSTEGCFAAAPGRCAGLVCLLWGSSALLNGQAERMNRTVKEVTVKAFHYPDFRALKAHVPAFIAGHNFVKHLKVLRWRTPFQAVCEAWTKEPSRFKVNPHHLIPRPNT